MIPAIDPEFDPPFLVEEPETASIPFVFNTPHSGASYPLSLIAASKLDPTALRRSEDAFVDKLFRGVVELGAPLLMARFPRAYLDVNREPYELDPRMFDARLPSYANTRSMRVAGGLGTIPRIVADGQEIYRTKLSLDEGLRRVERLYKPYHRKLRHLVHRTARDFGLAILIDCHSMPSTSIGRDEANRIDVVLGDRYGTSCSPVVTDLVEGALQGLGYVVVRNKPYAGGFITEHHGEPAHGRHALQIEINRSLYMDERTMALKPSFDALARDLRTTFAVVSRDCPGSLEPPRIAAE